MRDSHHLFNGSLESIWPENKSVASSRPGQALALPDPRCSGLIWSGDAAAPPNRPVELPTGDYVGSAACRSCHPDQHSAWYGSYHRTMTQVATEESVLGDFNNVQLSGKDIDVRLFKDGGQFLVELDLRNLGIKGAPELKGVFPVVLTTGSHHRQAYWMVDPIESQLMVLPYMYLRAERRWIPRHSGYIGTTGLGDTPEKEIFRSEYGRWSVICIKCHTTHAQPETPWIKPVPRRRCRASRSSVFPVRRATDPVKRTRAGNALRPRPISSTRRSSRTTARLRFVGSVTRSFSTAVSKRAREVASERLLVPPRRRFVRRSDPLYLARPHAASLMPDRPSHVLDPAESGSFWSDGMSRVTGHEVQTG